MGELVERLLDPRIDSVGGYNIRGINAERREAAVEIVRLREALDKIAYMRERDDKNCSFEVASMNELCMEEVAIGALGGRKS